MSSEGMTPTSELTTAPHSPVEGAEAEDPAVDRSSRGNLGRPPRGRRGALLPILLALSLLIAAAVSYTIWNRYFDEASSSVPGMSCPQIVQPTGHPPLVAPGIRRVALIGDSIMSQASCSVADSLASVGIQTARYAVPGTGLLSGSVDWVKATAFIMASEHPNAVIAIFVGNYFPPTGHDAFYETVPRNSPAFFAAWQKRAIELSDEVHAGGGQMYWVSPPPIQSPLANHAGQIFDGDESIKGDHTIDAGSILAGLNGQEVPSKATCGTTDVVRTADQVHLTDEGARIYGQEIAHLFTSQTGLLTSPKPC
jgi:hypothetical protein